MKTFIKSIYLILFFLFFFINTTKTFARDANIKYSQEEISNYFSGTVSLSQNNALKSFKYLKKIQPLKKKHINYNIQFIRTLVLLDKFNEAFDFADKIWKEDVLLFEADLLLGLQSYIKKDYKAAKKHFERLNEVSEYNYLFGDFFGNILNSWIEASKHNKKESFDIINNIPNRYDNLKQIQISFLHCYFDSSKTEVYFEKIIKNKDYSFSRYNFFLANYLISEDKNIAAKIFLNDKDNLKKSSLLIRQSFDFLKKDEDEKIQNFFSCKNPRDVIAEIFYIISNMYSSQKDYKLSNFYLKISLFLNEKFTPNKTLLAENYYFQKKYKLSRKIYNSLKSIGPIYSWYSSKSISIILQSTENTEKAIFYLEKEFKNLKNIEAEHYYELANFYRDNDNYKKAIKYYSTALENLKENNYLIPKILERRGMSYERIGDWDKAEKDLSKSIEILPDQPYVLNYLAYTWIEREANLDKALKMLNEAVNLKKNDGYIIDSLGWAYYALNDYIKAEKFLRQAVELKPLDPIINDHYADVLWMLKKNIQARYFWKHALSLNDLENDRREKINKKLIFGINKS